MRVNSERTVFRALCRNCLFGIFSLLLLSAPMAGAEFQPVSTNSPPYRLGVFPHLPPRELEKVFSPMAADLGRAIDRRVVLGSSTTYKKFMARLDNEEFDVAFVQPFDYVHIADEYGYRPLATRTEMLSAIVVVERGSAVKGVRQLKGKTIALPPKVAAVSHLIKGHLRDHGLVPGKDVTLSHHRSHVSCMQHVLIGEADACGTAAPALRFFQHRMDVKMNVVAKTKAIPHTLFVVHPRVPVAERERLQQRILSWSETEEGQALLSRGRLKPFRPIADADYDVVRDFFKN